MPFSSCEQREDGRKYKGKYQQDANVDCDLCIVMNIVAQPVQDVYRNHELYKNHNSNDQNDKAFDAFPRIVNLNTVRFITRFFRAEHILYGRLV